jgi:hypothetical protein
MLNEYGNVALALLERICKCPGDRERRFSLVRVIRGNDY